MFGNIQTCPRSVHPDWITEGSRDVLPCPWCALDAEPDAPAPYTEPRAADEVEVAPRPPSPIRGFVVRAPSGRFALGDALEARELVLLPGALDEAIAAGRVRLVKAAAPQFEAGRIYRDGYDDLYLYLPGAAPSADEPWFDIKDGGWFAEPSDLVPCDVVPREAT